MKNIIFAFLRISGILYWIIRINKRLGKVPILVFHDVSPIWNPYTEPLNPDTFEKIILQLQRHYKIRPIEDLLRIESSELKGSCFITFDDGLRNFLEYAIPVLKKHKVPVAMFLPTQVIDNNSTIWNYKLADLINEHNGIILKIVLNGKKYSYPIKNQNEKVEAFNKLTELLKSVNYDTIQNVINQISVKEKNTHTSFPLLKWSEIREIEKEGIANFYSHTHRHLFLPNQSEETIINELEESKDVLAKEIPSSKKFIAYPVGGFNNSVLTITSQYFNMGFAVGDQMLRLNRLRSKKYNFEIPRFHIANQSPTELLLRINGFHTLIKRLKVS